MKQKPTHILGLLLSLALLVGVMSFPVNAAGPSFYLSPNTIQKSIGETFSINVFLNTGGNRSTGADMILGYNATTLELQGVSNGSLYNQYINSSSAGQVNLSAISFPPNDFSGVGTFATLTFKALANGSSDLRFQFLPGSSTDSNISDTSGMDILSAVGSASITIGQTQNPTPPPAEPESKSEPEPKPVVIKETCDDSIKNQNETQVDCGGVCGGHWYNRTCNDEPQAVVLNIPKPQVNEEKKAEAPTPPKTEEAPVKIVVIEAPESIESPAPRPTPTKTATPAPIKTPKIIKTIETSEDSSVPKDEIFILQSIEAPSGYYYFPTNQSEGTAEYLASDDSWVVVLTPPLSYYLLTGGAFTILVFLLIVYLLLKISYLRGKLDGKRLAIELLDEVRHLRTITADDRDGEILAEDLERILIQDTAKAMHAADPFGSDQPKKDASSEEETPSKE